MKFSHALQFNSVPEWADYYIAYSNLKKLLYQIEKDVFTPPAYQTTQPINELDDSGRTSDDLHEDANLLDPAARCRALFLPALNIELKKIVDFYARKESELYSQYHHIRAEVDDVLQDSSVLIAMDGTATTHADKLKKTYSATNHATSWNTAGSSQHSLHSAHNRPMDDQPPSMETVNDPADNDLALSSPRMSVSSDLLDDNAARTRFAHRVRDLFILLSDLKSYANLNFTGFSKILKKYDKVTHSELKDAFINDSLRPAHPFCTETRQSLNQHILSLQRMYAELAGYKDVSEATKELRTYLRDQVVWERNTVWRDMIGQERKVQAVGVRPASMVMDEDEAPAKPRTFRDMLPPYTRQALAFVGCTVIFIILMAIETFDEPEQHNCLAILIYASLLWAFEALPLFVTSMLVPLLVTLLRVMRTSDPDPIRLSAPDATKAIFEAMFSPVIMLLLGGFSIAAALSKHNIAKSIASFVLSKAGTKPRNVLLMNMLVATVASMWISNVAAPVLCFSLIQPILRTLPPGSPFARCLIIGIALASNVGGMSSPISSPQNIIALENMDPKPNWGQWFAVALPVSIVADLLIWLFLLFLFKPADTTPAVHQARYVYEPFTVKQWLIIGATLGSIALWCLESTIHEVVGGMGIIAIVPMALFFGTGILTKEDFNNFLWTTIMLAMGGLALGKAVLSSGLLHTIAEGIQDSIEEFPVFGVYAVFCGLMLVMATFISHTVGAMIILPVVQTVGNSLPEPHPRLLVFGTALMCSGAMGLPVSGFPNMTAIMMEDETGRPYLTTKDFAIAGIPSSIIAYVIILTLGYGILLAMGF
ncbi:low-affinity phosphate transporter [Dimargaris verticillata]|uniref:Low-affinity phosphate transporter n=1 Tax=Dimargaris verticillata TaxID=2761393 RepID=A0A9W8B2E2_9FUNG|nr:low-affinity phosphate transporter [Dimargaris verticillata]